MDIKAIDYNNLGGTFFDLGKGLIKLIDRPQNSLDDRQYVLDIGCGDGKLTALIDKHLGGLLSIYGVDIDENMIEFAKQNYIETVGQKSIQYFTQDFGVQWNQLRPELKALESRVAVIFTNLTLHWIYASKENVAQNMSRFLNKNGKSYVIIYCIPNKNSGPGVTFKAINEQVQSVPTTEEQQKTWLDSFDKAGLDLIVGKLNSFTMQLSVEAYEKVKNQIILPITRQFLNSVEEKEIVNELYKTVPEDSVREFKDESTGKMMYEGKMQYFLFILGKK